MHSDDTVDKRTTKKTYSELSRLETFSERVTYLKLSGIVTDLTFGPDRIFNQMFYRSSEWKRIKSIVIARDNGLDLGLVPIGDHERTIVHHINPITMDDIVNKSDILLDPENLITTSFGTHNLIHYGYSTSPILSDAIERSPNDTCLWKGGKY